MLNYNDK